MFFLKTFRLTICKILVGKCNKNSRKSFMSVIERWIKRTSFLLLRWKQSNPDMSTLQSMKPDLIIRVGKKEISIHHFQIEMQCRSEMTWKQKICSRQDNRWDKCMILTMKQWKFKQKRTQWHSRINNSN